MPDTTHTKKGPKQQATTAFLALRNTIAAELDEGWRMTVIYSRYAIKLNVSYSQFTRYVRRFIRNKPVSRKNATANPIATKARQTKRFVFDPTVAHQRKDELF